MEQPARSAHARRCAVCRAVRGAPRRGADGCIAAPCRSAKQRAAPRRAAQRNGAFFKAFSIISRLDVYASSVAEKRPTWRDAYGCSAERSRRRGVASAGLPDVAARAGSEATRRDARENTSPVCAQRINPLGAARRQPRAVITSTNLYFRSPTTTTTTTTNTTRRKATRRARNAANKLAAIAV